MSTSVPDALLELRLAARDRVRAEAREWAALVSFRDDALTRLDRDVNPKRRQLERSAVNLEVARELRMSEGQVVNRLASADRLLEHAPLTWAAFRAGHIDASRVREIALTVEKLERDDSIQRLDDEAPTYARTHTVGELRRWGRRARWRSPVQRLRRCRASRGRASLASLDTWCRPMTAWPGSTFTSAVTDEVPATIGLKCDIAVTIDAGVLTGAVEGPAQAADGSWQVPTDWALESAFAGDAFWHRMLLDPISRDVLAHEYEGYHPPDVLRRAIAFRSGTCATPGCLTPADQCELDHLVPYPEGRTIGSNLGPRCKRDHDRKSHGIMLELLDRVPAIPTHGIAVDLVLAS